MATLDLAGMNVTLPDGTVFTTPYLTGSNNVTNSGLLNATLFEGGGPAGNTYSGVISDGAHSTTAVTQTSGDVTFASASTYSGGTNLEGGTIGIANASALGTGVLTMASGTTLEADANNLTFTNAIAFAGATTINDNGDNLNLGANISGTGSLSITGSGTLAVQSGNWSSYSGNIYLDAGTLTIQGGNWSSYSGNIYINAGTLNLSGSPSWTLGSGDLYMAAGTSLNFTPVRTSTLFFTVAAGLTNNIVLEGTVNISASAPFPDSGETILRGSISGPGSLIFNMSANIPLILTGNETYTGGTTIGSGDLGVAGSIIGNVTDDGGLFFVNPGTVSFGGQISGVGSVTTVSETLTLSGINSYSGGTTVQSGTLVVANNLALGTGTVTVEGFLESGNSNLTLADAIVIYAGGGVEAVNSGWTFTLSSGAGLTNNGTLETVGGTLNVDGAVTGTGTALITDGGTLQFGANFQQAVAFSGGIGAGTLGLSQLYNGTISGFAAADAIDFTTLAYKSSYEVLWLQNGNTGQLAIEDTATNTVVDSVTLNGTYNRSSFTLTMDSQGGTEIIGVPPATYDFPGNGISDVLFQNSGNGEAYEWLMNGTTVTSSGFAGNNTNPSWQVVTGAGDYNGDGKSDILWQNVSTGQVYEYEMNGTSVIASNYVGNNTDPTLRAVASGDFNGDGYSDILFQNINTGQVTEWEMNGFAVIGSGVVGNNTDPTWQVVGTGDFNGDGKSDILFQNTSSGQVYEWEMNGLSIIASNLVGNNTNPAWQVVGIGDLNGDGKSDILFQNSTTGQVYEWEMNGTTVIGSGFVGNNTNPAWQVVGTGDYSGNGQTDILFQNVTSGQVYEWVMNGTTLVTGSVVGNNTDPTWHAIGKT